MTCPDTLAKLPALPDPRRVPADVRAHLAGCPDCRAYAAALARAEAAVAGLPVPPPTPGVKEAFLARVADAGVIVRPPTVRRAGAGDRFADWLAAVSVRHAAGLAAGVLVAAGGVWWAAGPRPPVAKIKPPRHELLQREVGRLVELARATAPGERVEVWAKVAADVRAEAGRVYAVAEADDLRALHRMFARAVNDGIVRQVGHLPAHLPAAERKRVLDVARGELAAGEQDIRAWAAAAPPQSIPVLNQMAATARDALARLPGEGV